MIRLAQISPFDYCNNKCWYCPVRYYEQPKEYVRHMNPALFEKIISDIVSEKGKLVSDNFDFIYTAQYNEILLYRHLDKMLRTLRKYEIKTMILSNGVAFTEEKLDLVQEYRDVVAGINFNIPSFEASIWANETGNDQAVLPGVIENVKRVFAEFGQIVSVGMNGVSPEIMGGRVAYAKELFPGLNIYPVVGLCDRAGLLLDKGILSNLPEINANKESKTEIAGCRNGGRFEEWLHVNSQGKAFICCDDYFYKYEFGDFNTQTLSEIWQSEKRQEVIASAKKELCARCAFAVWK